MSMVTEEGQGQGQERHSQSCKDIVVHHGGTNDVSIEEEELALVALVEHRTSEVKKIRYFVSRYSNQLEGAEMRLKVSETKLARIRAQKIADQNQTNADQSDANEANASAVDTDAVSGAGLLEYRADQTVTTELIGSSGGAEFDGNEGSSRDQHQAKDKPKLVIPAVMPVMEFLRPRSSGQRRMLHIATENTETKVQGTKRKFEEKQQKPLIPLVRKSSRPGSVNYQTSNLISSQHKRKVRTLALCPVNDRLFVTSALDGVVKLWAVYSGGLDASVLSTTDCVSPVNRRWPEDIAWHPDGNSLFSVHSADGRDAQVSIMKLIREGRKREIQVNFLEDRPHVKGTINNIAFLPWEDTTFVTAGSDHAVILWREDGDNKWTSEPLHRNHHSSAVMGVCGVQQKQIVLSVGKDKKVLGYNADVGRNDFTHQVDARCLGILPNPRDFNLFVVQTGTPERQLRLFDIRSRRKEIHDFGWKQESSETQSALINPAWSPNGLYMTSGSADPVIHIFDIRYNGHKPSRSIEAHQKRVFKAAWLRSLPLLISISSDLNLGLHMFR